MKVMRLLILPFQISFKRHVIELRFSPLCPCTAINQNTLFVANIMIKTAMCKKTLKCRLLAPLAWKRLIQFITSNKKEKYWHFLKWWNFVILTSWGTQKRHFYSRTRHPSSVYSGFEISFSLWDSRKRRRRRFQNCCTHFSWQSLNGTYQNPLNTCLPLSSLIIFAKPMF